MGHTILESVSFQLNNQYRLAISVRITDKNDVYVNYLGDTAQRHTSYHASGQRHQKKRKQYIQWNAVSPAQWKPMKDAKGKPIAIFGREHVAVWGWEIQKIPEVLPLVQVQREMNIDISPLSHSAQNIVPLEVSILGGDAQERHDIYGFPIVLKHRLSNGQIFVEIEAFWIDEGQT